jgi:hypothetical protein
MFSGFSKVEQIGALLFIDALSATIGVYLLTTSDLNSTRTYILRLFFKEAQDAMKSIQQKLEALRKISAKLFTRSKWLRT